MRPVTKADPGTAYDFPVDVSNQDNLEASLKLIGIGTVKGKARKLFGTATPTAWDALSGLLLVAKDDGNEPVKKKNKKPGITAADIKAIKAGTLEPHLADIYRQAGAPLVTQIGRFCSFCEIYLGIVAVEHVAPKAPYPLFYIAWNNFLLACTPCNSNKLSQPARDEDIFDPEPDDEIGYYQTIGNTYLWPQKYTEVYRTTKPVLEYKDGGTWRRVDHPVGDGTALVTADEASLTVRANVRVNVKGKTSTKLLMNVEVRVSVNPTTAEGKEMVRLAALNKASGVSGKLTDNRMFLRTKKWFDALQALLLLKGATSSPTFEFGWQLMFASVQNPGLYSVWVTVIDQLAPGGAWKVPGSPGTSVMSRFLTAILGSPYFPGTDTADTP